LPISGITNFFAGAAPAGAGIACDWVDMALAEEAKHYEGNFRPITR